MDVEHLTSGAIVFAIVSAIGWFGKEIIKPWSDAYLLRSRAFVQYVETMGKGFGELVQEVKDQTPLLESTKDTLAKIDSDNQKLCKGGACPVSPLLLEKMLNELKELKEQGSRAADALLEKTK